MKNKLKLFLSILILIIWQCLFADEIPNQSKIHFISTGNSDAILICNNNEYALIDGGDNNDEKMLVNYLKNQGVNELKYLILTHPDADHCGGLDAVVNNFTIKNVFVGNGDAETKTYQEFVTACINKNLQPSVPLENKIFKLGNGTLKFYNQKSNYNDANNNSLITLYTNNSIKCLLMGDAKQEVESILPLNEIGKIDILKVGHHGAKTSSSDNFIKSINPKYAVICCGKNNKYGHPHKETLETLQKYNVKVFRTDIDGNIIFKLDKIISINKQKNK